MKTAVFVRGMLTLLLLGCAVWGMFRLPWIMNVQSPLVKEQQMLDFHMRRNEVCCVREGVDPFLVWRGDICDERFTPWSFAKAKGERELLPFRRFVHAYPPWEYSLMLPFAFLDQMNAGCVYIGLMFLSLLTLSALAVRVGLRLTGRLWCGLLMLSAVWLLYSPFGCCVMYGNFGVVIAASAAVAMWCQMRGHDSLAGVCWTLCFVKPQIATILLIPLLVLRKWRTLAVTAVGLAALTLVSAALCHRMPLEMILCIREYSAGQFGSLALVSSSLFQTLTEEGGVPSGLLIVSSAVVVGIACVVLTVFLAQFVEGWGDVTHKCPWLRDAVVFVPAFALSTVWASARVHDLSVQSITIGLVLSAALAIRNIGVRLVGFLLVLSIGFQHRDLVLRWEVNVFHVASVGLLFVWCWLLVRLGRANQEAI